MIVTGDDFFTLGTGPEEGSFRSKAEQGHDRQLSRKECARTPAAIGEALLSPRSSSMGVVSGCLCRPYAFCDYMGCCHCGASAVILRINDMNYEKKRGGNGK